MNDLVDVHPGRSGPVAIGLRSTPFLVMVTKNSPRAGRARLLQGENYV